MIWIQCTINIKVRTWESLLNDVKRKANAGKGDPNLGLCVCTLPKWHWNTLYLCIRTILVFYYV